jgi:glycosyltransferase involved in cell wall biosynthesis
VRILGIVDADAIHTSKWANYFAARGHEVHLVSFNSVSKHTLLGYHPSVTLEPWRIPSFHLKRLWITVGAVRRLRTIMRQRQSQIVHVHFLGHAAWLVALARLRPLVISVMGGGDITGSAWRPSSMRERTLTPLALRRSDLVLCWSRNLATIVAKLLQPGTEVQVVVGGIDIGRFRRRPEAGDLRRSLGFDSADFVMFSPRLFRPLSNIDTIIRALPLVRETIPRARLLMLKYRAGDYPEYETAMERLVDDLGIRPFVRFWPSVPNPEMPLYYSVADCTVSIPQTDGTPMTVMESAACETPAIILDLPDYDPALFVHGRTVIRLPSLDPVTLADVVVDLASNNEPSETLRREGRGMALRHADYDAEMQRVQGFYDKLLEMDS